MDRQLDNIEPLLDNWNGKNDAGKQKLERYLEKLKEDLGPLPADERDLFLHMDIAGPPEHYLNQHDLDNYLTPVAKKLGAEYFVLVSGRKHVGGVSRLIIGRAQPGEAMGEDRDWMHATIDPILMSAQHPDWKAKVRERLLSQQPSQLPPGPVEVHLSWRYAALWSWAPLWKPTIDAMGPVLGEPHPPPPFAPDDGRIVSLGLHLLRDKTLGLTPVIGINWRQAPK